MAASPISNVGTARVDEGRLSIEHRTCYTLDGESAREDQQLRTRVHLDYGFTDDYALLLIAEQSRLNGDNLEHNVITLQNRIQLFEQDTHGFDGGVRVIYGHRDGDKTPHELDLRLMGMGRFGQQNEWEWRQNIIFERDLGENSRPGWQLELRSQLMREIPSPSPLFTRFRIGAELFADIGRLNELSGYDHQDNQFGPVLKASFSNGYYLQTGYRAGISDAAADHSVKLFVGKRF